MNIDQLVGQMTREDSKKMLSALIQDMPELDVLEILKTELPETILEELRA